MSVQIVSSSELKSLGHGILSPEELAELLGEPEVKKTEYSAAADMSASDCQDRTKSVTTDSLGPNSVG